MADVILTDGNIGAGKTKTVQEIEENKELFLPFIEEDEESTIETVIEHYDDVGMKIYYAYRGQSIGYNELFEKDQIHNRLWRMVKAKHSKGLFVFDRGLIPSVAAFTENAFDECNLDILARKRIYGTLDWGIDVLGRKDYMSWSERLTVFIKTDPEICYQRQLTRNTEGETIPLEYFERIGKKYDQFYDQHDPSVREKFYGQWGLPAPQVLLIDGNIDFHDNPDYHKQVIDQIITKMTQMGLKKR